jgi:hypothetical protein
MRNLLPILILSLVVSVGSKSRAAPKEIKLAPPVKLKLGGKFVKISHSGPNLIDFDGDKKLDLLVGNIWGAVRFFKNTGTSAEPKYTDNGPLKANGVVVDLDNW